MEELKFAKETIMKGYTVVKLPGREENIDRFGVKSSKKELVAEMYITHEEASWSISFLYFCSTTC